jgi:glycosyltransferase involved in cell wall biosynthesis
MKVSVLLAVYNGAPTVKETIDSILAQTHKDLEILAVDDSSTDKSAEIIKGYKDERVRYFKQPNTGSPASPRNLGVKSSTGEMLAICDQDDIWYPGKLEKQLASYEKSPDKENIGIIYCQADFIDEQGKKIGVSDDLHDGFLDNKSAYTNMIYGDYVRACSALFPKKVVLEVGNFNEDLHGNDEYDLWLRITKKYGTLGLPETLCAWRRSDLSFSINVSRVYAENEKIFTRLQKESPNDELIQIGHGRNLNRVMVAGVLEGNQKLALEFAEKAKAFPVSLKGKVMSYLIRNHYKWAERILKSYERKGEVSI